MQNATELPVFRALANMPERAMAFASAMMWHAMLPGYSAQYLVTAFPWGSGGELTVVDVGGGRGHISQALVEHSPSVKCIVEDSSHIVVQGQESLPANLGGRISFQAHDFFKEQPVKGADVYLLRLILHDWSDKYSKLIIKALIPALKHGAKVVVNDRVVPECGETNYLTEREARSVLLYRYMANKTDKSLQSDADMYMLAFQNAKERTANDWTTLFKEADPRFKLTRLSQPSKSSLAIVEVTWDG